MPGKSVREASTQRGKRRSTALPPERQFKLDPPPKMFFSSPLLLRQPFCLGFCASRDPEPALEPLMLHQVMHLAGSPGKVWRTCCSEAWRVAVVGFFGLGTGPSPEGITFPRPTFLLVLLALGESGSASAAVTPGVYQGFSWAAGTCCC